MVITSTLFSSSESGSLILHNRDAIGSHGKSAAKSEEAGGTGSRRPSRRRHSAAATLSEDSNMVSLARLTGSDTESSSSADQGDNAESAEADAKRSPEHTPSVGMESIMEVLSDRNVESDGTASTNTSNDAQETVVVSSGDSTGESLADKSAHGVEPGQSSKAFSEEDSEANEESRNNLTNPAPGSAHGALANITNRQLLAMGGWAEYRVLYDFNAENENELSLQRGQRILIVADEPEVKGWLRGRAAGRFGYVPAQFVEPIPPESSAHALARLGQMPTLKDQRHEIERIRADVLGETHESVQTVPSCTEGESSPSTEAQGASDGCTGTASACQYCGAVLVRGTAKEITGASASVKVYRPEGDGTDEGITLSDDRTEFLETINALLRRMGRVGDHKSAALTVPEAKLVLFAQIHRGPAGIVPGQVSEL